VHFKEMPRMRGNEMESIVGVAGHHGEYDLTLLLEVLK
jgi:hypothetical protein